MNDTAVSPEPNGDDSPVSAVDLREKMVGTLVSEGTIVSAQVEGAMRRVPRELFAPGVDLEEVYQLYNGVVTKRDKAGTSVSSVSAPQVQAHMLEQAEIAEGMNVLEIGSGGYNAALIKELVGRSGQVTTVDIDKDITDRATRSTPRTTGSRTDVSSTRRTVESQSPDPIRQPLRQVMRPWIGPPGKESDPHVAGPNQEPTNHGFLDGTAGTTLDRMTAIALRRGR